MSELPRVVEVAALDFALAPRRWDFAETHRAEIDAHWERVRAQKPASFSGRVLLLAQASLLPAADGAMRLAGTFFEVAYADFVAWIAFGHPGAPVDNCFSMAALRGADGAFLLGEMADHTVNGGRVYFPAGTPDLEDVIGGKVDLEASAKRELFEETGVSAGETVVAPGWTVIFSGRRIACMKAMTLPVPADEAKARIDAFLARDPSAELKRMHVVRERADLDPARTPDFVAAYIEAMRAKAA